MDLSVTLKAIVDEGLLTAEAAGIWLVRLFYPGPDTPPGGTPWDPWLAAEWRRAPRETAAQIRDYYDSDPHVVFQAQQCGAWGACGVQEEWQVGRDLAGATVLDHGCGGGRDGIGCLRSGAAVTFCDASARLRAGIRRVCADNGATAEFLGDDDSLGEGCFDLVITTDVLEHLLDPVGTLQRLVAATKIGGHISQRAFFGTHDLAPYHLLANVTLHDKWEAISKEAGLEPLRMEGDSTYQGLWRRLR